MHPLFPSSGACRAALHPLAHALLCLGLSMPLQAALAQPAAQTLRFDIAAQPLASALDQFARQAGLQLVFTPSLAAQRQAPAVRGELPLRQALDDLLAGSGLQGHVQEGTLTVQPVAAIEKTLAEVRVSARRAIDGTTEGTGSYTSRVTSIASKTDQSFREIPQSVSVITRQQLDDRRMTDIRDALAATPGITTSQINFDSTYFYSRGFQIDSMQIDGGAPLNIAQYTYSVNQSMDFYDRVEVMRGASGLLGGVGDPGGIINIVRKKPLAEPRFVVQQSIGSWNNYQTMVDATGPLALDGRVRGRAVLSYQDTDQFVDIKHTRAPQFYGVVEADLTPDTLLTVGMSRSKIRTRGDGGGDVPRYSDGSDIGLPRHTSFTQPWATGRKDNSELFGALEHRFSARWKGKLNLTRSKSSYDGSTVFGYGALDPATGLGVNWNGGGHYLYENRQTVLDASLAGSFDLGGRTHEILLGMDRQKVESFWNVGYSTDATGVEPIDVYNPGAWRPAPAGEISRRYNPWGQDQSGGYGVLRLHPTDRLHVIVGARYAKYRFNQVYESLNAAGQWELASGSRFSEPAKFTPYGGVIYDLNNQWSAYLSYSSILKPQALSKSGPPPGNSLDPVKGKSYEAGFKGELADGRLNATFSLFNVVRTGTAVTDTRYPSNHEEWSGNCCFLPQGKVTSRGFDAEIGGELRPGWQIAAGYTYTTTRDKTEDAPYSSITPRHLLKLSTAYVLPGELSRWKIGGSAHIQSKHHVRDTLYDADWNEVGRYNFTQGGYSVINAMVQYRIDPRWTVSLNLNNIFDKTYYQTVGYASGGNFYGKPRNAVLTLRGTF
ncbi:iron complex outermembrane receptor protein/outer membrane receptor for ferric coprogen and ferric-rhodotorulic acid [Delftia acidovorans]|uniref:TonB-dependent siderophore receptor n=1 Tax=Delftia acidovorans TaxID=80866 RepID=UPI000F4D1F08|nr:TonB-dependent receptor [Delftia acidovorans]ROR02239.1 iron complex outermembrane receptor protein/outer membrane receptor for ferric coprogen and ferric-rhodotorulic acid [Delftia acidovorans]